MLNRLLRDVHHLEEGGRSPSVESVAGYSGLPTQHVARLLRVGAEPVSIFEPLGRDGPEFASAMADTTARSPDDTAVAALVRAEIDRLLSELDSRDREVVWLRFGLDGDEPRSLDSVAKALGRSREAVRQSQARALRCLRQAALASPENHELLVD